jgi:hypothetical protein
MVLKIFDNILYLLDNIIKTKDETTTKHNKNKKSTNNNFKKFIKTNTSWILENIFKCDNIKYIGNYKLTEKNKDKCIKCNEVYKIIEEYIKINKFKYIYFDKIFEFDSLFVIKKCDKVLFNSYYLDSNSKIPKKYVLVTTKEKCGVKIYIYFKCTVLQNQINFKSNKNDLVLKDKSNSSSTFVWDTTTPTLFYNDTTLGKCPVILVGTSITTLQYAASLYSPDTFYDFTKNTTNDNLTQLINFLQTIPINLSTTEMSKIPCLRIPLCVDYWLNGSAPASVVNIYFTAQQYQNAIIQIVNKVYGSINFLTVIIDLHWNYSTSYPQQSFNGTGGNNYNSGQQLPLCGVFISDTSAKTTGTLPDNTLSFWKSIANVFGVDSSGNELNANSVNSRLKPNIFFELYNEPFCDKLVGSANQAYVPHNMYNTKYDLYINGGDAYLNYTSQKFSFTGLGVLYNELRNMNCYNIFVMSSAENYAYFDFTSGDQWNYYYQGIDPNVSNTLKNTYNCFTCLRDSIENTNGLFVKKPSGGNYQSLTFNGVLLNSHPYSGLYSGALKIGGYHNPTLNNDPNNNIPGYAQIISSFQNNLMGEFYMSAPSIVTEYGQYDLPWSEYSNGNSNKVSSDFAYPSNYKNQSGASLGTPYYNGTWYDENKIQNIGPAIIPYLHNYVSFNVSFTIWAWRPNSGGNGDAVGCNTYAPGYGWAATQPDLVAGSFAYSGNLVNGNPCVGTLQSQIISANTQDLNLEKNLGCQGPDFDYISTTYIQ